MKLSHLPNRGGRWMAFERGAFDGPCADRTQEAVSTISGGRMAPRENLGHGLVSRGETHAPETVRTATDL